MSHQKKFQSFPSKSVAWPPLFAYTKDCPKKYKGKNVIGPILLPFLQTRSNQLKLLARLQHLYSWFNRHPYWSHFMPYGQMQIWPYGQNRVSICSSWPSWFLFRSPSFGWCFVSDERVYDCVWKVVSAVLLAYFWVAVLFVCLLFYLSTAWQSEILTHDRYALVTFFVVWLIFFIHSAWAKVLDSRPA